MTWLIGWNRRKSKIVIGTVDGAQPHFQMLTIRVHRTIGTDTPSGANDTIQHIHAGANVRTDFGDVRFTAADGITLIPYWMVSFTSGAFADFVVRVPSIPANPGQVTIFVYYDSPTATSISNGANTFEFFDDFNRANSTSLGGQWTEFGDGLWAISENILHRPDVTSAVLTHMALATTFGVQTNVTVRVKIRVTHFSGSDERLGLIVRSNTGTDLTHRGYCLCWHEVITQVRFLDSNFAWLSSTSKPAHVLGDWWWFEFQVIGTTLRGKAWRVGDAAPTVWCLTETRTTVASGLVGVVTDRAGVAAGDFDDFCVRRTTVNEPSWGATGAEEIVGMIFQTDTITATDTISHIEISQADTIAATDIISYREIQVADTIIAIDHAPHITKDDIVWIYVIDTITATDTISGRVIQVVDTIVGADIISDRVIQVVDTITATDIIASMISVSRDVIIDVGRDSVIKCTVSHNINDATRMCTCEIEGSVPLREFEFFTITDRDFLGNPRVIFFGFAVIIRRKMEGGLATMTMNAFDAGYYLTTQKITMGDICAWSDRTFTYEPTHKIWKMLGGLNWLTTTTINPKWLFQTSHGKPLRQFDFKTTDTLQKVFTELADWYDAVFTLSYNVRASGQVETIAHFVHRSVIDRDLELPPQVVFTNPNDFILGYDIETDHKRLVNRVRVNGIWAERGEWFFTSRSTTLAAGELIREYVEEFTPQPTPATRADFEAQVTARLNLLFDILTDTRRAQFLTFSVKNRPDLRLFQLVSFTGFADIPTFTWRIVEITYNIVAASSVQTVKCVFDTFNNSALSIPKVREILNAEDSVQNIQSICEGEIEKLPEVMVGRVISVSADGRHAEIELERGLQRVRVRIV